MRRNLTLTIEEDILQAARKVALDQNTSVNEIIREHLAKLAITAPKPTKPAKTRRHTSAKPKAKEGWLQGILEMRGMGRDLWKDEDPDEYVRRLREGWE